MAEVGDELATVAREGGRRRTGRTSYLVVLGATLDALADRGDGEARAMRDRIEHSVAGPHRRTVARWHALRDEESR